MSFPKEDIPNNSKLYYRVHITNIIDGAVVPGSFKELGSGMSTDWEKYSTPEQSLKRARVPIENSIVHFVVGELRSIPLEVEHTPDDELNNQAHTDVKGISGVNKQKVRLNLLGLFKWEILPPVPVKRNEQTEKNFIAGKEYTTAADLS
jgi:hypothetical protein